jgi:signal peptidase I
VRSDLHSPVLPSPLPVPEALRGPIPVPSLDVRGLGPASGTASRSRWWVIEWLVVVVVALLLAVGVRTYVAQMFFIPSGSMLPTLQIGDRIVVDKLSYELHGVGRGDIVVFRRPPLERADYSDLVKRVIGLPGDTIWSVGGRVYIDGKPLAEPWLRQPLPVTSPSPVPYAFSLAHPYTVPAGEYFVMGDNRTNSEDSRYFGAISGNLIVGKMAFVVWPLSDLTWMLVLSAVAAVLSVMLVVTLLGPRRSPHHRPSPARGPPPSRIPG